MTKRLTPEREQVIREQVRGYKALHTYPGNNDYADTHGPCMEELLSEIDGLRFEKDLAIAHDRQPYPTAEAYELACKSREKYREERDQLKTENENINKHLVVARQPGVLTDAGHTAAKALAQDDKCQP